MTVDEPNFLRMDPKAGSSQFLLVSRVTASSGGMLAGLRRWAFVWCSHCAWRMCELANHSHLEGTPSCRHQHTPHPDFLDADTLEIRNH